MKTRIMIFAGLAFLLVSAAGAQTKVTGTQNCAKADVVSSTDAGDRPGHALVVQKGSCTWTTGLQMAGGTSKDGTSVEFMEVWTTRAVNDGVYVGTMDNGDKFFVSYHSMNTMKDGQPTGPIKGTWSYTGGTGKLKGIKGKGTYTATPNADGSSVVAVEGDYTIPAPAAPKPKTTK